MQTDKTSLFSSAYQYVHKYFFFFCIIIFDSLQFLLSFNSTVRCSSQSFLTLLILALACLLTQQFFVLNFHLWQVLIPTVVYNSQCWLSSNCSFLCSFGYISSNPTFLCLLFSFWLIMIFSLVTAHELLFWLLLPLIF